MINPDLPFICQVSIPELKSCEDLKNSMILINEQGDANKYFNDGCHSIFLEHINAMNEIIDDIDIKSDFNRKNNIFKVIRTNTEKGIALVTTKISLILVVIKTKIIVAAIFIKAHSQLTNGKMTYTRSTGILNNILIGCAIITTVGSLYYNRHRFLKC